MQQLSKTDSEYRDLTEPVEILSSVFLLLLANVLKPIKAQLNLNTLKKKKVCSKSKELIHRNKSTDLFKTSQSDQEQSSFRSCDDANWIKSISIREIKQSLFPMRSAFHNHCISADCLHPQKNRLIEESYHTSWYRGQFSSHLYKTSAAAFCPSKALWHSQAEMVKTEPSFCGDQRYTVWNASEC